MILTTHYFYSDIKEKAVQRQLHKPLEVLDAYIKLYKVYDTALFWQCQERTVYMKYGNSFYMELSRAIFDNDHQKQMSRNAKWLFVCLNEMEQRRCTGKGQDWFLCTDKELCELSGFSINTLKQAKSELRKTDLIEVTRGHWKYAETGKSSVKQPTVYRILR